MRIHRPKINVPALTLPQRQAFAALLDSEFGISTLQQHEMAGALAAEVARDAFLKGICQDKGVVVLVGKGFKAGAALVCARRLHGWGARVRLWHCEIPLQPTAFTRVHLHSLQRMGAIAIENPTHKAHLVLDGLLDLGEDARSQVKAGEMIGWANTQLAPVLALDLPSGIHPEVGAGMHAPVLRASATIAMGLPMKGLLEERARPYVGEIYLADLGAPSTLWAAPGLGGMDVGGLFSESPLLKLR